MRSRAAFVRRVAQLGAHGVDLSTRLSKIFRPDTKWNPQLNEAVPELELSHTKRCSGFTKGNLPILIGCAGRKLYPLAGLLLSGDRTRVTSFHCH